MNWGDTLCGVKVTPEAWYRPGIADNGIVADILGGWWGLSKVWGKWLQDNSNYRPIFPPRGWAGKTDAELWAAVVGSETFTMYLGEAGRYSIFVRPDMTLTGHEHPMKSTELPALALHINNVITLARRLQGATDEQG